MRPFSTSLHSKKSWNYSSTCTAWIPRLLGAVILLPSGQEAIVGIRVPSDVCIWSMIFICVFFFVCLAKQKGGYCSVLDAGLGGGMVVTSFYRDLNETILYFLFVCMNHGPFFKYLCCCGDFYQLPVNSPSQVARGRLCILAATFWPRLCVTIMRERGAAVAVAVAIVIADTMTVPCVRFGPGRGSWRWKREREREHKEMGCIYISRAIDHCSIGCQGIGDNRFVILLLVSCFFCSPLSL